MSWLDGWRHRLAVLVGRDAYAREIDDEVAHHLELSALHAQLANGNADDARSAARRQFGNVTYAKEEVRRMTGYITLDTILQDLRVAQRAFVRNPGFVLAVVATLAVGIGANTAIFSFVNAVLLRPLPYPSPGQLTVLQTRLASGEIEEASYPDFVDWRDQTRSFSQVGAFSNSNDNYAPPGADPERIPSARVTANFFATLGVTPRLGRGFTSLDEVFGSHRVIVLSDALWRRFGADSTIVGRSVTLNSVAYAVIGVAPPELRMPERAELWAPLSADPAGPGPSRRNDFLHVVGRLKPGVTLQAAQADLDALAKRLAVAYPNTNAKVGIVADRAHDLLVGQVKPALLMFAAAVGVVLLIACANIANLLLARATARHREMALRVALGAGRGRLVRQMLTESLALSLVGGAAGVVFALWAVQALKGIVPPNTPRLASVRVDGVVLGFSALLSIVTGVVFGLVPSLRVSGTALRDGLSDGGRGASGGGADRLRGALVLAQTALALVLLAGSGLLLRSFVQLQHVDLGFNERGVLTVQLVVPPVKYPTPTRQLVFFEAVRDRVRAIPGVQAAALTSDIPLGPGFGYNSLAIQGRPPVQPGEPEPDAIPTVADTGYFRTMGIALSDGRLFTAADRDSAPLVAVVNAEMMRRHFGGRSPVGERITFGNPARGAAWLTIVGVVQNTRLEGVGRESYPQVYQPAAQSPQRAMYVVARTSADPMSLVPAIRREVAAIDAAQPLSDVKSMAQRVDGSIGQARLNSILVGVFSVFALVLASIGIYGVISYSVVQRTREIGIRIALGASTPTVVRLVMRQGLAPVVLGVVVGLAGSMALTRLMSGLLFGVGANDPLTFVAATAVLTTVASVACLVPALRAARVMPTEALRAD